MNLGTGIITKENIQEFQRIKELKEQGYSVESDPYDRT